MQKAIAIVIPIPVTKLTKDKAIVKCMLLSTDTVKYDNRTLNFMQII